MQNYRENFDKTNLERRNFADKKDHHKNVIKNRNFNFIFKLLAIESK